MDLPAVPERLTSPRYRVGTSISHADNAMTQRLPDGRLMIVASGARKGKRKRAKKRGDDPLQQEDLKAYVMGLPDMVAVWKLLFAMRTTAPRIAESLLDTLHAMAVREVDALYQPVGTRFLPEENVIVHRYRREGMFDLSIQKRFPRLWQAYAYIPEDYADASDVWYKEATELREVIAGQKASLCRAMVAYAVRMSDPDVALSLQDLSLA